MNKNSFPVKNWNLWRCHNIEKDYYIELFIVNLHQNIVQYKLEQ